MPGVVYMIVALDRLLVVLTALYGITRSSTIKTVVEQYRLSHSQYARAVSSIATPYRGQAQMSFASPKGRHVWRYFMTSTET